MKTKKIDIKFFTVMEYDKEAEYLSKMHRNGWKLSYVTFPCFYHFVRTQPEDVRYQLDYNRDSEFQHNSYIQMFEDCGWEYLFDFVGYSYFRKPTVMMDSDTEEIFCDDESRLDMIRRMFKGRIIPLILLFFIFLLPATGNTFYRMQESFSENITLLIVLVLLSILYLMIFIQFAVRYYQFKKKLGK